MQSSNQSLGRISSSVLVFCFFFLLYALTVYGQLRFGDETERYLQAQSLVERQSFQIRFVPGHQTLAPDGKNYSQFELGYGILLIPFYSLGKFIGGFFSYPEPNWIPLLFTFFLNPVVTALTCLILFRFSTSLGIKHNTSFMITLLYGFATMAWPYTKGLYREPVQGLTLLLAVYALVLYRRGGATKWVWLSAICFGYLVFTKVGNAMMLPLFWGYLLVVFIEQQPAGKTWPLSRWVKWGLGMLAFLIPTLALLGIQGVVNLVKYKDLFVIGPANYSDPLPYFSFANLPQGVLGLLFAPEKSVFIYSPPVILFLAAWLVFLRKNKVDAIFVMLLIVANILFNGAYRLWGTVNWGPRYLVLVIPLMILPIGLLVQDSVGWRRRLALLGIGLIFLLGLCVQLVAAFTDDREFLGVLPNGGDLFIAFDLLRHGTIESLIVSLDPLTDQLSVSPWAWVSIILAIIIGVGIILQAKRPTNQTWRISSRLSWVVLAAVLAIQFGSLWTWILARYPRVLQATADAKYHGAELYFSEGKFCLAERLYTRALFSDTQYVRQGKARLEEIRPLGRGTEVALVDLASTVNGSDTVQVDEDSQVTLSANRSLRISSPAGKEIQVEVDSEFIPVAPSTLYELAGWYRTQGLNGMGYAVVGWYEDDGAWQNRRDMDILDVNESGGWRPFVRQITTLPTTRRIMLKRGLWNTYGTFWIDGLRLVQLDANLMVQSKPLCPN